MCGICGICGSSGPEGSESRLGAMLDALAHRGPDDRGRFEDRQALVELGHNRLAILDLSAAGHQPMASASGRFHLVLNGEIYNYLELRRELKDVRWRSQSDTEVLLELWEREGAACLERCRGMFAFAIWDEREQELTLVRDRFGVKPLHYAKQGDKLLFASEIPALFAAGAEKGPNLETWATYLQFGLYDHGEATFWQGITRLLPGHLLRYSPHTGALEPKRWYDPARQAAAGQDGRRDGEVLAELEHLLEETIALRLRADVEVGVCLSGGLDSSLLLGLLRRRLGQDTNLRSYSFYCGDERYDELPWIEKMLGGTQVRSTFCRLDAAEVPTLASQIQAHQAEPFGGLPTLGMAKVFAAAKADGIKVLLDGNGMDEAWAGYDYYARVGDIDLSRGPVQGSRSPSVRPEALNPAFAALAQKLEPRQPFADPLTNAQLRDLESAKIPRSLRFSDRVSMLHGCELREPFLDHHLVELGLRQPRERKIRPGTHGKDEGKWLVRQVAKKLLPEGLTEAPKRPVQTPQREWLRSELAPWAEATIEKALAARPDFFDRQAVRRTLKSYLEGEGDNSFPIWQWISVGLLF